MLAVWPVFEINFALLSHLIQDTQKKELCIYRNSVTSPSSIFTHQQEDNGGHIKE